MDRSPTIELPHLEAALALWRYAEESARYIFGDATGDAVADRIMEALRTAPDGLSRNEIRDLFARNVSAGRIATAHSELERLERARQKKKASGKGRPQERWHAKNE